jgi:hypothetical protein
MNEILRKDIAISESGLIFNPITGESFSVNPMGIGIMNHLREGKSIEEIKEYLVKEFEVDNDTAERDVLDFMNLLKYFQITAG